MGAALTYARRYALFTLVGIAGEDDVDAPDLNAQSVTGNSGTIAFNENKEGAINADMVSADQQRPPLRKGKAIHVHRPVLDHDASTRLREQLATDMKSITSADTAADWAARILSAKNQFALEMDHFSRCIQENLRPRTPGEEGLQDQVLMEAIYEAARTGAPVKVGPPPGAGSGLDVTRGPEPEEPS